MTASTFDPANWLARAQALGRHVEVVGRSVYFGRAGPGAEADDAALFAELRDAGGVKVLKTYLQRRAGRPAATTPPSTVALL